MPPFFLLFTTRDRRRAEGRAEPAAAITCEPTWLQYVSFHHNVATHHHRICNIDRDHPLLTIPCNIDRKSQLLIIACAALIMIIKSSLQVPLTTSSFSTSKRDQLQILT